MLTKCGQNCYLLPKKLKFPICDKQCNVSCRGLTAAKIRSKQHNYTEVYKKAMKLSKSKCSTKTSVPKPKKTVPKPKKFVPKTKKFVPKTKKTVPKPKKFVPKTKKFVPKTKKSVVLKPKKSVVLKPKKSVPKPKKLKTDRPSPSESANLFKEGFIRRGNDGKMYIIKQTSNSKRWFKIKN